MKRTSRVIACLYIVGVLIFSYNSQGKDASLSSLIIQLTDEDARVRYSATEALGEIGEPAKEAVVALIKALNDSEYRVREKAAGALKKIGTSEALIAVKNAR
jgi:HEAT repeat protein